MIKWLISNWPWCVVVLYVLVAIFFRAHLRRIWKNRMKDPEELRQIAFWAAVWWLILGGGLLFHNLLSKKSPEQEEEK